MAHSNQIREFILTNNGVKLVDVVLGPQGVVTGSSRVALSSQEDVDRITRVQAKEARLRMLEHRRAALDARITAMQAEFNAEAQAAELEIAQAELREERMAGERATLAKKRLEKAAPRLGREGR